MVIRILTEKGNRGFALPTVIITSVTMMIVLLASLQALTSITVSIKEQYNQKLLSEAAESGSIFASYCLKEKSNATWTQLRSETNCDGTSPQTCTQVATDPCSVMRSEGFRTYFTVSSPVKNGVDTQVNVTAKLEFTRTSSGAVYRTLNSSKKLGVTQLRNLAQDRAIQRYWKVGDTGSSLFDFGVSGTNAPSISPQSGPSFSEGLTVVTDVKGNYLFSSNGINIWNKNNQAMAGSFGASNSTAQGVVAFPINGKNRYLIVSNSATRDNSSDYGGYGELTTGIVDMELNGGLGNIVAGSTATHTRTILNASSQNVPANPIVTNPNGGQKYTSEFMTAAPEASGNGYWVAFGTPGRQYFYAVLFGNDGQFVKVVRSTTPDNSTIPVCKYGTYYTIGVGIARFSSNYDKLAVATGTTNCQANEGSLPTSWGPSANKDRGAIYFLSFNTVTGAFGLVYSNPSSQSFAGSTICMDTSNSGVIENIAYSIDFSPNEDYLYYTTLFASDLYRYRITGSDLQSGATSVASTAQFLGHADNYLSSQQNNTYPRGGQVRRAPNNKMYVANQRSTSISVVNNPDDTMTQPSCSGRATNFSYNSVGLGGSVTSGRGLPDYVTQYIPRSIQY